jgi:purine-nucleoside phosphorylase
MTKSLTELAGRKHEVAVVCGSGLAPAATALIGGDPIPYAQIEGMTEVSVHGHEGALYSGEVGGVSTAVLAGRVHLYEGHEAAVVTRAVDTVVTQGTRVVVLTNAAGAINPELEVGAPCLISDHLNLTGDNPLAGAHDGRGARFPDLSDVYSRRLRELAFEVDPNLKEGIYAGMLGPTFETPAEIRMLRTLGADLVGMSTVLEAITARYLGAEVLGISVVSNKAAGLSQSPLTHDEVTVAGRRALGRLERLLRGVIERIH